MGYDTKAIVEDFQTFFAGIGTQADGKHWERHCEQAHRRVTGWLFLAGYLAVGSVPRICWPIRVPPTTH